MTDSLDTDALRKLAGRAASDGTEYIWQADAMLALRFAADEVDRLRSVIDNAPHDSLCYMRALAFPHCTCWKADV